MNMKLLEVVTLSQDIYHGCSTMNTLWGYKFTPVNMTSCENRNVRKHREINNGKQYIILDMYSKLDCLENRKVTSS